MTYANPTPLISPDSPTRKNPTMTYQHGIAKARKIVQQQQDEVTKLYAEGRKLANTANQLRKRNANIEQTIADETAKLETARAKLTATLAGIEAAQVEADLAIREAEARAAVIAELAADQARALAERAYASGFERGNDQARAKHHLLTNWAPRPRPALRSVECDQQDAAA